MERQTVRGLNDVILYESLDIHHLPIGCFPLLVYLDLGQQAQIWLHYCVAEEILFLSCPHLDCLSLKPSEPAS